MELRPQRIICSFLGDKAISWIFQDIEVFLKKQKLQNYIDKKRKQTFFVYNFGKFIKKINAPLASCVQYPCQP